MKLNVEKLREYLSSLYKGKVVLEYVGEIAKAPEKRVLKKELKGFGYGNPILVEFKIGGKRRRVVLETMRPGGFGHDYLADRAQSVILAHSTFNKLPTHVRSVDVGALTRTGSMLSAGDAAEYFLLVDYAEGEEYYKDLEKIKTEGKLYELDKRRSQALSNYLAKIHAVKRGDPQLYVRRIRDLIGHGECIMGLVDSYPSKLDFIDESEFIEFEKRCIEWRWRIKGKAHRLCQVHGDFHPWNVLFRKGLDFTVLDRSRGEWGEAADDLSAMTINYFFYSLQAYGRLEGPFEELWKTFFTEYLEKTGDYEVLTVIQPFFAWRSLVVASPIWYPTLQLDIRKKLFKFLREVLDEEVFDFRQVNSYIQG